MHPVRTENDLFLLRRSATAFAALAAWAEAGHLEALKSGPRRLAELGGDERALVITAPLLGHLGLLAGVGELWTLTPEARRMLDEGAFRGLGTSTLRELGRMGDVLREGGPVRDDAGRPQATTGGVVAHDPAAARRFLDMLWRRSEVSAADAAGWLGARLRPGAHVLDLGGGHGRYARAFVDAGLRATIFDLPVAVAVARDRLGDAVAYREGDFFADDLGGPYDAVFLSNIIHGNGPDGNRRLFAKIAASLSPGGVVVVKDMVLDDLGTHPATAVFFGVTMLFYTREGRSYAVGEIASWGRDAGLGGAVEVVNGPEYALIFLSAESA